MKNMSLCKNYFNDVVGYFSSREPRYRATLSVRDADTKKRPRVMKTFQANSESFTMPQISARPSSKPMMMLTIQTVKQIERMFFKSMKCDFTQMKTNEAVKKPAF
jgi:hypothetical protein